MASGLATIASQIGGVTDVIKSAAMGLTFTDGDAHALAKAIIYLEGKPMERASVGRFAREYVLVNYPFSNIAKQYLDLYQSLMT
jgi:glycosyltransferase involved in cell wall biosynthesis